MKAVLISIQPKWCELIASGKKMVEVRKTKPKIETPFKCYIYCTQGKGITDNYRLENNDLGNSKVIGEFVCDEIKEITADNLVAIYFNNPQESTCLNDLEMRRYADGKSLFLWHISDLVIYDKPKELGEFNYPHYQDCNIKCSNCKYGISVDTTLGTEYDCDRTVTRPPQSWCYVEELR